MRVRYSAKRYTLKWKNRKQEKYRYKEQKKIKARRQHKKPHLVHSAPIQFSLIKNTKGVLKYFHDAEELMKAGENVKFDISNVEELTSDTIALLVAHVKDEDSRHGCDVSGNEPKDPKLRKIFAESGFYKHVTALTFRQSRKDALLHQEVNKVVVTKVAKEASLLGLRNVFNSEDSNEGLYNTIIECMSNTNNHADFNGEGKCNWWLYVYNHPDEHRTSYSFFDLGVGIFRSAGVQNYLARKIMKVTGVKKDIDLVNDLLAGKIKSKAKRDKDIRGKGIPEIVKHSKLGQFKEFYLIANDVKVDLKTGAREELPYELGGTFWHWELAKNNGN